MRETREHVTTEQRYNCQRRDRGYARRRQAGRYERVEW
jgi:hypothetical protein